MEEIQLQSFKFFKLFHLYYSCIIYTIAYHSMRPLYFFKTFSVSSVWFVDVYDTGMEGKTGTAVNVLFSFPNV